MGKILFPEEIKEMQSDRNSGMSVAEVAAKHEVSVGTVLDWTRDPLMYEWDYWTKRILDSCRKSKKKINSGG